MRLGFLLFLGYVGLYVLGVQVDGNIYLRTVIDDLRIVYIIFATFPLYNLIIKPIDKKTKWNLRGERDPEEDKIAESIRTGMNNHAR